MHLQELRQAGKHEPPGAPVICMTRATRSSSAVHTTSSALHAHTVPFAPPLCVVCLGGQH